MLPCMNFCFFECHMTGTSTCFSMHTNPHHALKDSPISKFLSSAVGNTNFTINATKYWWVLIKRNDGHLLKILFL